jgi:hypothetical protein
MRRAGRTHAETKRRIFDAVVELSCDRGGRRWSCQEEMEVIGRAADPEQPYCEKQVRRVVNELVAERQLRKRRLPNEGRRRDGSYGRRQWVCELWVPKGVRRLPRVASGCSSARNVRAPNGKTILRGDRGSSLRSEPLACARAAKRASRKPRLVTRVQRRAFTEYLAIAGWTNVDPRRRGRVNRAVGESLRVVVQSGLRPRDADDVDFLAREIRRRAAWILRRWPRVAWVSPELLLTHWHMLDRELEREARRSRARQIDAGQRWFA